MVSEFYNGYVKKNNMLFGILIIALVTSIFFIIIPTGFFFTGDIHLLIGTLVGEYFTFKTRKETQSFIKLGVIVGAAGAFLALILDALFFWIAYLIPGGYEYLLYFFLYLAVSSGIIYIMIGIIVGLLFGISFRNRAAREESPLL